jgi:ketosteroid isomerase-like protein
MLFRSTFILFVLIFVVSCGNSKSDSQIEQNAAAAENFIYNVLNNPKDARDLMHEDFTFRYMGKIPIYAQGNAVIKTSYNKDTYFTEFLGDVRPLLKSIVLTPLQVIADEENAAVIMSGKGEGIHGEYDNDYVFTFTFKDGKIIKLDEYNSDILAAEALYGNTIWPNSSPSLLEYIWHKKGPDYSEENFNMLVEKWNSYVDQTSCNIRRSHVLTPKVKNKNFDFVWMLVWPSDTARDECIEEWFSDHEDNWQQDIAGIMSNDFENASFLFSQEIGQIPKSWSDAETFTHTYYFCNFNEGANADTLHNYRADLNAITDFSDNHWYTLLEPKFVPEESFDVIWLDIWASEEDKASDTAKWKATEFPQRAADMLTCGDNGITGIDFSGIKVRD